MDVSSVSSSMFFSCKEESRGHDEKRDEESWVRVRSTWCECVRGSVCGCVMSALVSSLDSVLIYTSSSAASLFVNMTFTLTYSYVTYIKARENVFSCVSISAAHIYCLWLFSICLLFLCFSDVTF